MKGFAGPWKRIAVDPQEVADARRKERRVERLDGSPALQPGVAVDRMKGE